MSENDTPPDAVAPRQAASEPKPSLLHGVATTYSSPIAWLRRHQDKVAAEMERNRRDDYTVPTWVLTLLLVVVVGGFAALLIFG